MGVEAKNCVLYLDSKPLNIFDMSPITFNPDIDIGNKVRSFSNCQSGTFTGTISRTKMSRKKFVHNLIKQGYSKKVAKQLAWYCNGKRIPYGAANDLIALGLSVR